MSGDRNANILFAQFGSGSPCWRLSSDSNALELMPAAGEIPANVAVTLTGKQAAQIRRFTGVTAHLALDVRLLGEPLRLHLVGKKLDGAVWAGTASTAEDTASVAHDLVHGLSFAEQVVSEVNSVVLIIDRHGHIQRFNRLAEEVTGLREEDVIGKNIGVLFSRADATTASSDSIENLLDHDESSEIEQMMKTVYGERLYLFRNKLIRRGDDIDEQFLICSGTDVAEVRRAQQRLMELVNTDSLTASRTEIRFTRESALAFPGPPKASRLASCSSTSTTSKRSTTTMVMFLATGC